MTPPLLVIVSGLPGAGKSTVAKQIGERLRLPIVDRDDLKDTLFDALGWSDRAWSQRIGRASWDLLFMMVGRMVAGGASVVVDTNFNSDHRPRFAELRSRVPLRVVEVHCDAPPETCARRFRQRWEAGDRHPGHTAAFASEEAYMAELASRPWGPVGLDGRVIVVDTTGAVDVGAVAAEIVTMGEDRCSS